MGKESLIEKRSNRFAKDVLGFFQRKYKTPSNRAAPDDIYQGTNGKFFFIEYKAPGKKPTDLQYRELKILNSRGEKCAYWVDNFEDAKEIFLQYT